MCRRGRIFPLDLFQNPEGKLLLCEFRIHIFRQIVFFFWLIGVFEYIV